jgi:DNA invertase Pin-like site-specific DNA recombinase
MIAAIYARKSTEQTGVNDDEKSVTRQIEHAKAYAKKKGWTVAEEHVYLDDGISGAEFVKRPGFLRLMNALKPRPPFQVLVMSEESRLGRESIETAYALKQIMDAGTRVFFYLEGRERTLDTALDKVMLSLTNFAAEMEREKASQRTHDAMRRKAEKMQVTGCKVYGYDNVDVFSDVVSPDSQRQRVYVVRRVNPDEAKVVRRLFEQYAGGGVGLAALAKDLNADKVPPPRKGGKGWAPSCIREILRRELYRGHVIWNKTQAIHRGGTRKSRKRPEHDWIRLEAPDLRIVSEDLWGQVQKRLELTATQYARLSNGRLCGHPSGADIRTPYLLSGLAQCAICGGSLVGVPRGKDHGRSFYACAYHRSRGREICGNALRINQHVLDSAFLTSLSGMLDEQVIAAAVARALDQIKVRQTEFPERRVVFERQLSLVDARLRHLVEAVATGKSSEAIFSALHNAEAEKKAISTALAELDGMAQVVSLQGKGLMGLLRGRAVDMKGLLNRHIPQSRQMLRKLIDGRIVCRPFEDDRGKGYEFAATGTYAGLLGRGVAVSDGQNGCPPPSNMTPSFALNSMDLRWRPSHHYVPHFLR